MFMLFSPLFTGVMPASYSFWVGSHLWEIVTVNSVASALDAFLAIVPHDVTTEWVTAYAGHQVQNTSVVLSYFSFERFSWELT